MFAALFGLIGDIINWAISEFVLLFIVAVFAWITGQVS